MSVACILCFVSIFDFSFLDNVQMYEFCELRVRGPVLGSKSLSRLQYKGILFVPAFLLVNIGTNDTEQHSGSKLGVAGAFTELLATNDVVQVDQYIFD